MVSMGILYLTLLPFLILVVLLTGPIIISFGSPLLVSTMFIIALVGMAISLIGGIVFLIIGLLNKKRGDNSECRTICVINGENMLSYKEQVESILISAKYSLVPRGQEYVWEHIGNSFPVCKCIMVQFNDNSMRISGWVRDVGGGEYTLVMDNSWQSTPFPLLFLFVGIPYKETKKVFDKILSVFPPNMPRNYLQCVPKNNGTTYMPQNNGMYYQQQGYNRAPYQPGNYPPNYNGGNYPPNNNGYGQPNYNGGNYPPNNNGYEQPNYNGGNYPPNNNGYGQPNYNGGNYPPNNNGGNYNR